jgi:hypothetical protein
MSIGKAFGSPMATSVHCLGGWPKVADEDQRIVVCCEQATMVSSWRGHWPSSALSAGSRSREYPGASPGPSCGDQPDRCPRAPARLVANRPRWTPRFAPSPPVPQEDAHRSHRERQRLARERIGMHGQREPPVHRPAARPSRGSRRVRGVVRHHRAPSAGSSP